MHTIKSQTTSEAGINLLELLRFLASHWFWYLLSIVLFMSYFIYDYAKTPYVYNRSATIMIRTPDNTPETVRIRRNGSVGSRIDGTAEILQLQTKELMRSAVSRIHADVSYTVMDGIRRKELYVQSPVTVSFPDAGSGTSFSFELTPRDEKSVVLSGFLSGEQITATLQDTISTPVGRMVVTQTDTYGKAYTGVGIRVTKYDQEVMVNYFLSNLRIQQLQPTVPILRLSINDNSGARATDLLYTLINTFNEKSIEEKNRVALNAGSFIAERLSLIEQELGHVENNLQTLKERNAGLDINTAAGMYISDSREYQSKYKALDMRLQVVDYMKQYLESGIKFDELIPNSAGLESAEIERLISGYNNMVLQRNRLAEGNNRNNPVVREIDKSLAQKRGNLLLAIESLHSRLLMIKENFLQEERAARAKIMSVPEKLREVLSIGRQQKVKEDLYIFLLNKREENALNGAMTDSNARIIDSPSGSMAPISPKRFNKMAMGAGCGFLLPTFVLLLLFKFDTRVKSRKDIEGVVSVPFMGCIPLYKQKKKQEPILVKAESRDALSEAFRILRTNLGFVFTQHKENKVITCISFNPGSGKTFVSLNLGACLSLAKKKVVVLDLDLRKATLSNLTRLRKHKGITNYLTDETVRIDEVIQHNLYDAGIDVIPAGAIPPNPSELLLNNRLDTLLSELKERYDYIVIDNVPIGMVADSAIINRVTDISLFIVRSGTLNRAQLLELDQLYKDNKLKNMCVLLNGVKKLSEYGYGYGYGYTSE